MFVRVYYKHMVFKNRKEAGELLAESLKRINFDLSGVLILGLPRGGVIVAAEIAKDLRLPLDVIVTRKIGAPENVEFALAAVDADGEYLADKKYSREIEYYIEKQAQKEKEEIKRRLKKYRGKEAHPGFKEKKIFLVDDGIATGQTMISAIRYTKKHGAKKVYVAVPVLPADTITEIENEADGLFYLFAPDSFWAVGQFYIDFPQVTDREVIKTLRPIKKL